jgi:hypothetical protein
MESEENGTVSFIERFHKYCSHTVEGNKENAVLLGLGVVSAQSQATTGMLLYQKPMIGTTRPKRKILAPSGYSISSSAQRVFATDDRWALMGDEAFLLGVRRRLRVKTSASTNRFFVEFDFVSLKILDHRPAAKGSICRLN